MNAEQYRRANRSSFYVCLVIILSGLGITIFNCFREEFTVGKVAIFIAAAVGGLLIFLGNYKFPTIKKGSVLIMGGATIFYFVLLIAEDDLIYFAFGLPILICSIIYLNVKLCKVGISAIILSFTITCIKAYVISHTLDMLHVPAFITLALAFIACLYTVTLLTRFNEDNKKRRG